MNWPHFVLVSIAAPLLLYGGVILGASPEATSNSYAGTVISGTYISNITGDVWGLGSNRKLQVVIHRKDDHVYGSFGNGGTIRGDVEENQISFEWISIRAKGNGVWKIDPGGSSFNGTWEALTTTGNGEWDLVKTGPAPEPDLDHESEIEAQNAMTDNNPDITGSYVSEITSKHSWYFDKKVNRSLALTLTQSGNTITGYDSANVAVITGTRDRNTIKFRFWAEGITAYELRGTWIINPEDNRLEGSWIQPSHDATGQWNLAKSE